MLVGGMEYIEPDRGRQVNWRLIYGHTCKIGQDVGHAFSRSLSIILSQCRSLLVCGDLLLAGAALAGFGPLLGAIGCRL